MHMNSADGVMIEKLWSVKEATARTGFSTWFIYQEIARGHLRCVRLGKNRRTIRIAPSDVARYLAQHKTGSQDTVAHRSTDRGTGGEGQ